MSMTMRTFQTFRACVDVAMLDVDARPLPAGPDVLIHWPRADGAAAGQ